MIDATEGGEGSERPVVEGVSPGMTLADGRVAEAVFALIKVRGEDGTTEWIRERPRTFANEEELLGALIIQTEILKAELLDQWE